MKALSTWSLFSWLIARQHKRIETRPWSTDYRGWLAIHAARKAVPSKLITSGMIARDVADRARALLNVPALDDMPRGCIVAVCRIQACEPVHRIVNITETERLFGNYGPGRFGFALIDIVELSVPLSVSGKQWMWDLTRAEAIEIERRAAR